ncbi:MAG TPA: lysophospholipid acyltransferase family protein [Tepidisphaeraceae bacterium]|jgi:1-acyl-sn-glycerol-3-phosphate acyltransferase
MIAFLIRLVTGVTARWVDFDPGDPACAPQRVFFANHASNLDGPVIWASLPKECRRNTRPVAARDYWLGGPIRRYLSQRVFKCVLVERKKITPSNNPLREMEAALEGGASLIIFPAGTRSEADAAGVAVGEFRPGLWHLSKKHSNAQFVPVYLENLNRILPKGEFLWIPLLAAVRFGRPMELIAGEPKQAFLDRAKAIIEKLKADGAANA